MPETILSQYSILVFFLLTLAVMVIMFVHHHIGSRTSNLGPHTSQPNPTDDTSNLDLAPSDLDIDELENYYRESLAKSLNEYKTRYEEQSTKAEAEFVQFLADLKVKSETTQQLLDEVKQERIDKLFNTLEIQLTQVINDTVSKTLATIQSELEQSRKSVENYAQKQLTLIDQNAIDLLEKTLSIVLIKKMSLRDQLDLVYEAIEKAKAEKFLVGALASQSQPNPTPEQPKT